MWFRLPQHQRLPERALYKSLETLNALLGATAEREDLRLAGPHAVAAGNEGGCGDGLCGGRRKGEPEQSRFSLKGAVLLYFRSRFFMTRPIQLNPCAICSTRPGRRLCFALASICKSAVRTRLSSPFVKVLAESSNTDHTPFAPDQAAQERSQRQTQALLIRNLFKRPKLVPLRCLYLMFARHVCSRPTSETPAIVDELIASGETSFHRHHEPSSTICNGAGMKRSIA